VPTLVLKSAVSALVVPEVAPGTVPPTQFDTVLQLPLVAPVLSQIPSDAEAEAARNSSGATASAPRGMNFWVFIGLLICL